LHLPLDVETQANWHQFLQEILASEAAHYHWLRSLSYLEYIGYRKMVKALDYGEMNQGVYHHLTDEIRHSYMLKELARKVHDGKFQHVPFEKELVAMAESYFHDIDMAVHHWVVASSGEERPFLCYLLTSYLIEKRAMSVYPSYFNHIQEGDAKVIIQKIIKDEKEHLNYLENHLAALPEKSAFDQSALWQYESGRFHEYLNQIRQFSLPYLH
jgi:bacterioferritin (cytochrome b1)